MAEPNYKVIELETENDKLKDEIIKMLRGKIVELEQRLVKYESGNQFIEEIDVGSNMIDQRQVIRTTSELSALLEQRSLKRKDNTQNA